MRNQRFRRKGVAGAAVVAVTAGARQFIRPISQGLCSRSMSVSEVQRLWGYTAEAAEPVGRWSQLGMRRCSSICE
eukprot:38056-Eustigmatos_ZCMA.PRE.1